MVGGDVERLADAGGAGGDALDGRIRADQLASVRRSVRIAIPVNALLGLAILVVATRSGQGTDAAIWFGCSTVVNLARLRFCHRPVLPAGGDDGPADPQAVSRVLRLCWLLALLSGIVWAFVPTLCEGFTAPNAPFFLTVVCGITAGAVTHGMAYARVPVAFITPPLLSVACVLAAGGGFDRTCLAATVVLYGFALVRSARQTEAGFRETSRLKHEATTLAASLSEAHAHSLRVAADMRMRAAHDGLTGLLNRAGFHGELARRWSAPGAPDCLLLLDLDGFKSVNDAFGHAAGDRVLVEVAERLRTGVPPDSLVARLGGDEFAVAFPSSASVETPEALASRLIAAVMVASSVVPGGRLGVGIGICGRDGLSAAEMLVGADEALYAAKSGGRNRFRSFDDRLRRRRAVRLDVERDLPGALAAGRLELWFQPIFRGGGRTLGGFEALLRWNHPAHGWIAPNEIVAIASASGSSEPLLRFVLDEACRMSRRLSQVQVPVPISVNVSPRELARLPVPRIVAERLAHAAVLAPSIEIEITEEAVVDLAAVGGKLADLRQAGIRVAVDDFGVGFASLASLRDLRPERVKIDRSFVTGLSDSADSRSLIAAVLALGRSMGFDVVAEGVETAADLTALRDLGCHGLQGYFLGRPMPAAAALRWVDATRSAAAA